MARIVSVYLHRWPILRFLAAQALAAPARSPSARAPVNPGLPFVLSTDDAGTPRITATNAAAEQAGLTRHDTLADARARVDRLQVGVADPQADDKALRRLALWATRYTPAAACWDERSGAEGFFLDVTGAAHLFGGEESLLADLQARLTHFGLEARLAIAGTPGAAWALSRCGTRRIESVACGEEAEALSPLPVEALRLSHDTRVALRRLGLKRVGTLTGLPRAPLAARFEKELLLRLDQAFGRACEPLDFIVAPPLYHSARYLLEPAFTTDAVIRIAGRLMRDICHALTRDGVGARDLRLSLYRVDGEATMVDLGLTRPTRDAAHVERLLQLKLERIAHDVEAGFGFETLDLAVTKAEPLQDWQTELIADADTIAHSGESAALIDRLRQRLGPHSVRRHAAVESHLPECTETPIDVIGEAPAWPAPDDARPRPLILLTQVEPLEVMAAVPDGPPQHFRWRGALHQVALAQGPERIACEWWREAQQPTRDYYLVEDREGRRFWIYRAGLYARETQQAQWFVHGLYA